MKKFLRVLAVSAFLIVSAAPVWAQGKTDIFIFGRDKGSVNSLQADNTTYLDVQKTIKKLGGDVEIFAASKQIKVSFKGLYAVLSAGEKAIIINARTHTLPERVIAYRSALYAPVDFFLMKEIADVTNREISFHKNALYVERKYTLALEEKQQTANYDTIVLSKRGRVAYGSTQKNKHTLEVVFPDVVLKRETNWRLKDAFISSVGISQRGKDAVMKVILGKKGKAWSFGEEGGKLILKVAETKALAPAAPVAPDAPSVLDANLDEADDAEEMDLGGSLTPSVIAPVEPGEALTPVIRPVDPPVIAAPVKKKMRIMIDPGHGGKDPGAVRKGVPREKELNLAVAKHLYDYLKKAGFEVKMTRDKDVFIPLADRAKIANNFKADLFVSIHTNASKRSSADGFEVYFRSDKATDKEAAEVAALENEALQYEEAHYNFVEVLLQSLAKNEFMNESSKVAGHVRNYVYREPGIGIAVRQANSIRQANFYVLKGVNSPAILVEMGYISSAKDRRRLAMKPVQQKMAAGIGKGIVSYAKAEGWVK